MRKFIKKLVIQVDYFPQTDWLWSFDMVENEGSYNTKTDYKQARYWVPENKVWSANGPLLSPYNGTTTSYAEWPGAAEPYDLSGIATAPQFMAVIGPTWTWPTAPVHTAQVLGRDANSGNDTVAKSVAAMNAKAAKVMNAFNLRQSLSSKLMTAYKLKPPFGELASAQTELALPALDAPIKAAFNRHWLTSPWSVDVEFKPTDPKRMTPNDQMPIFHALGTVTAKLPTRFVENIEVLVYYDTATFLYSTSLTYLETDDIKFVDEYNKALLVRQSAAATGQPLPALKTRPLDLDKIEEPLKSHLEEWWATYDEAQRAVRAEPLPQSELDALAVKLGLPVGSTPAAVQSALEAAAVDKTAGTPWWKDILGSVSKGAGKVWDSVTNWGPKELVGAYAGYEVVKSAKKSSIPMWLIVGGVGLTAYAISR